MDPDTYSFSQDYKLDKTGPNMVKTSHSHFQAYKQNTWEEEDERIIGAMSYEVPGEHCGFSFPIYSPPHSKLSEQGSNRIS